MNTGEVVLIVVLVVVLGYFLFFYKKKKKGCGCTGGLIRPKEGDSCLTDGTDLTGNAIKVPGIITNGVCVSTVVS